MKVTIKYLFENFTDRNRITVYQREDGLYYVLETPFNPAEANDGNVREHHGITVEEVSRMINREMRVLSP